MPPSPPEGNINAADPSRRSEAPKQHGVKGAYVGGKWIDIEEGLLEKIKSTKIISSMFQAISMRYNRKKMLNNGPD